MKPHVYAPTAHLLGHIDPSTGSITGIVSVVSKKVDSLVMPSGFYDKKQASNAVGIFYERYVAYMLGGSRSSNANAQTPDVQLDTKNRAYNLLFEVKAGHRTNGIVLKRRQLETFAKFSNCSYAIVFHSSPDIQKRWSSSRNARKTIRKELENDYSSLFILPPELLVKFYEEHQSREQPMPHYERSEEKYISAKESHVRHLFDSYEGPLEKTSYGRFHIISSDLELDTTRDRPPYLFRKQP